MRRRVVLFALLAWFVWGGARGALDLVGELAASDLGWIARTLTASEEYRLARTLAQQDLEQDLAPGYHLALLRALEEHVDPTGEIQVVRRPGLNRQRQLPALNNLVFPRVFRVSDGSVPPAADQPSWFLDFRDERREVLATRRSPIASGPDWVLWR